MITPKGLGHSQEDPNTKRGMSELLKDIHNLHNSIWHMCEKCNTPVLKPLRHCPSCIKKLINKEIEEDDYYCSECETWQPASYMIEYRVTGYQNSINRCRDCAEEHEVDYA